MIEKRRRQGLQEVADINSITMMVERGLCTEASFVQAFQQNLSLKNESVFLF